MIWAGDITYIYTEEGWLYFAVVIDLFNREVVGWALSSRINKAIVIQALSMAVTLRKIVYSIQTVEVNIVVKISEKNYPVMDLCKV